MGRPEVALLPGCPAAICGSASPEDVQYTAQFRYIERMGLLNEEGDRLARRIQRALVRAGLQDIATLSVEPGQGRRLVLRHGLSLHRIEAVPFGPDPVHPQGAPGWLPLVVAGTLDDTTVWELADAGVSFLDERGNAHLVLDGHTVLFNRAATGRSASTRGRPSHEGSRPASKRAPALPLSRVSHQVAFALLCDPQLADAPVRRLAAVAGVSLGTAHSTSNELVEAGFLANGRLLNAGRLLDAWVVAYQRVAFPPLTPRPLYAPDGEWVEQLRVDPTPDAFVGGAVAAGLLTGRLRATDGIAYVRDVGRVVKLLRLTPSPTAYRVDLRERFWGEGLPSPQPGLAPSVLVYGDLLRDGDDRSLEVARDLREHDAQLLALG